MKCDELKAVHAFDVYEAYTKTGDDEAAQVYLKSEADKVIADLGQKLAAAQQMLRLNKYKRCLAMARWCDEVMMSCELRGYAVHRILANKHQWAMRWKYRWLTLADKFKPNSTINIVITWEK